MQDNKVQQFMSEVHQWADETFGENRQVASVASHLVQEAQELTDALKLYKEYPTDKNKIKVHKEFADCFILILNAASKHGLTLEDLLRFSENKMGQNKERIWSEPDKDGVCNHVKEIRGVSTARYIELHGRALAIEHSKQERNAPKVEVVQGSLRVEPPAPSTHAKTHAEAIARMFERGADVRAFSTLVGVNAIREGGIVSMGVDAGAFNDLLRMVLNTIGAKKYKCILYVVDKDQYKDCCQK